MDYICFMSQLTDDQNLTVSHVVHLDPAVLTKFSRVRYVCPKLLVYAQHSLAVSMTCVQKSQITEMCRALEDAQNHVHNIFCQLWLLHRYVSHDAVPLQLMY